ncbi:MAG: Tex family protein [Desulfovibrio sp.]
MDTLEKRIASEINCSHKSVGSVLEMLQEGATVPFIARYRKERTGGLDEVQILQVRDTWNTLIALDKRRESIASSIQEQGKMTDALQGKISAAKTLTELEDIYLPYKTKRKTRGTKAKEAGLMGLAVKIIKGEEINLSTAKTFLAPDKGIDDEAAAFSGARDIIAEQLNEDAKVRQTVRRVFKQSALIKSVVKKGKEEEGKRFLDYYEYSEPVKRVAGHRFLAVVRGEDEGVLRVTLRPNESLALDGLKRAFVRGRGFAAEQMTLAVQDGYKRLLMPAMENALRKELKEKADEEAISVFASNLRGLLMGSPMGQKRLLALDPGFRTGAKAACLDAQGRLLYWETIFPTGGQGQRAKAEDSVRKMIAKYKLEVAAVGNGTAGRETEEFLKNLGVDIPVIMVDEAGASVYSASEVARDEFPDLDLTYRGAVSIGRRLMDPLAELVKIDPKAIGVGQYQHDVDQGQLKGALGDVVEQCVNAVGVELNTASAQLLSYVSGLGPVLAKNIIDYRDEHGPFQSRRELLKVPRLGPKAFEQAAGFLRIRKGKNPLDCSAVHPESYKIVEKMAKDCGVKVTDLMGSAEARALIELEQYVTATKGLPTLRDIMSELEKPGRDPRKEFTVFSFDENVQDMKDLYEGMILPGLVTNVTKFGAFVDIGVHQDGLVHISCLTDGYVKDPADVVHVRQQVQVKVLGVDIARKRISLTMVL